jgi:Zn ribbon nucleic-acid-binding protein
MSTEQYNGDMCPKCRRCMVVATPIPDDRTTRVRCVGCGYQGTLKEFMEAFDTEWIE